MKDYLVTSDYGQRDNIFIVLAKNAKEAIEQVYQQYVIPMNEDIKRKNKEVGYNSYRICLKSELHARSIGSLHNEDGENYSSELKRRSNTHDINKETRKRVKWQN